MSYDIILSGPITGIPDYAERFAIACCSVRHEVYRKTGKLPSVFNPAAELDAGRDLTYHVEERHKAIRSSPHATVVMLRGWSDCLLCKSEHALALCFGMKVEVL